MFYWQSQNGTRPWQYIGIRISTCKAISALPTAFGPHRLEVIVYFILIKYIFMGWWIISKWDLAMVAAYLDKGNRKAYIILYSRLKTIRGTKKDQKVNDRKRQTPFLCFPCPSSIYHSLLCQCVCLLCAGGTHCYICILMTPPVAPEAGPSALPRDQLGPGPGVCCAPL